MAGFALLRLGVYRDETGRLPALRELAERLQCRRGLSSTALVLSVPLRRLLRDCQT
jgi:hypothetical protein